MHQFKPPFAALLALASCLWSATADAQQAPVMLRVNPKLEDVRLEVELFQQAPVDPQTGSVTVNGQTYQGSQSQGWTYSGRGVTLGLPVLVRTSWFDTDFSKYACNARVDGRPATLDPAKVFSRAPRSAEATLRFDVPFELGWCSFVLVQCTYQAQVWDLQVDEDRAARATWPREWPSGMERFLGAEPGVDPTNQALKSAAEGATRGGPRAVTPFIAGKNAVLAICGRWRSASSTTSIYGQKGALRGINFSDSATAASGYSARPAGIDAGGTPIELAATCVAGLRSINIPARVLTCLTSRSSRSGSSNGKGDSVQFRFICELFVPDVGWIPFDPMVVRQQSTSQLAGPIKGFANVSDLRDCLPLAYRLVPDGYTKADRFAAWGWKANLGTDLQIDTERAVSRISFDTTGRGNGKIPQMPAPVSDEAP